MKPYLEQIELASKALAAFDEASGVADEAWMANAAQNVEPSLQDTQMRAVILGLRANLLIQGFRLGGEVAETPATAKDEAELMTSTAAGRVMGVHTKSVQRYADQGLLESVRTPGGHRRITRGSVLKLVQPHL